MNYYKTEISGSYFDQWTWFNRGGKYRAAGIGQDMVGVRRFARFDRTTTVNCEVIAFHFGPWVAYLYRSFVASGAK